MSRGISKKKKKSKENNLSQAAAGCLIVQTFDIPLIFMLYILLSLIFGTLVFLSPNIYECGLIDFITRKVVIFFYGFACHLMMFGRTMASTFLFL